MARPQLRVVGGTEAAPRPRRRITWWHGLGAAIGLLAAAGAWWLYENPPTADQQATTALLVLFIVWVVVKIRGVNARSKLPIVGRVIVVHKRGLW